MASRPVASSALSPSKPLRASRAASARPAAAAPLQKGQQTRAVILAAALAQASRTGLEGLSIGALADVTGMSKSGVFAHFGSREELQIAVVAEYHQRFEQEVFFPALAEPRGLPRLRAMFDRWVRQVAVEVENGCIYISGAVEFDDRPGPVRDALVTMVKTWHAALHKAIVLAREAGHLAPEADIAQLLFELHGFILSLHHDARFLRSPGALQHARTGFERVVRSVITPLGEQLSQAAAQRPSPLRRKAR